MNSPQTIQTQQSQYTFPAPTIPPAVFEMTFEEIVQLFGDLTQLITTLQSVLETGQNHLPTIEIDD